MGTVSTDRVLLRDWYVENNGQPGSFGVLSRDSTQPIYIDAGWVTGHKEEGMELARIGDSIEFDLLNVDWYRIRAASYPTAVLINATNAPVSLTAAPYTQPQPPTVHKDVTIVSATTTVLWTPATGRRFVITHAEISSAAAGRTMLIDDTDAAGRRLLGGTFGAGGGVDSNASIPSGAVNRVLKVVTDNTGPIFVAVDGYETA